MNDVQKKINESGRGWPHLLIGLAIALVGVAFLFENLDIHIFDEFWMWWPMILIAVGVGRVFSGRSDERTFGAILLFVGTVFLLQFTFGFEISLAQFWPVILIIVGFSMATRAFRGPQAPGGAADLASVVRERAIVGGISRKNTSQSFQGGELTAIMGGCEVDLRESRMAGPQAVLDCFTMWGGIEITIPRDWAVDPQVSVIAAGFEDKTTPPVQPVGRLVIRGTALMAGIEVKN